MAVLEVQDAVLLEDRTEHGLDNHAGSGVGDERGLLVKLAGEQVNTEVAVLASGSRGRDADDLASTSLEDDKVTNTDVVARDGDSVGDGAGAIGAARARGRAALLTDLYVNVLVVVMVVARVNNAVSKVVNSLAERVVVTFLVVVTHLGFLLGAIEMSGFNGLGDLYVLLVGSRTAVVSFNGVLVDTDVLGLVRLRSGIYGRVVDGTVALAVFTFSNVNSRGVWLAVRVDLNVSVSELGACGPVVLLDVLLRNETGTAAMFFFTRKTDLLLVVLVRRVLAFPSGCLLLRKVDVDLLVSLGGGLGLAVLIGRGEDAKGHRYAGFKVQVDDFCKRERIFSYNLSKLAARKEDKKDL